MSNIACSNELTGPLDGRSLRAGSVKAGPVHRSSRHTWRVEAVYARADELVGACLPALVALLPSTALAQGTIGGLVKDTTGAVLPGVTVEAASPVLIEKVRTTISDGNGRYQIIDLRPGSYTVTFTLPGFNTVKRDGVTVAGSGNVAVDADLRVGALEETVTVTGEAPVVDTQSITQQRVLNSDMVDALPSARNYFGLARMIPGTLGGGNDVGGSLIQDVGQSVIVARQQERRSARHGQRRQHDDAAGRRQHRRPDAGRRLGFRSDGGHHLALGGSRRPAACASTSCPRTAATASRTRRS